MQNNLLLPKSELTGKLHSNYKLTKSESKYSCFYVLASSSIQSIQSEDSWNIMQSHLCNTTLSVMM